MVLDPFMGVGTTCVAAKKHSRAFIGIDNSRKYCDVAEQRISEYLL